MEIDVEGCRIRQYRFIHTEKLRGFNFLKTRKKFEASDDLAGERDIVTERLLEKCEMDYTYYGVFAILGVLLLSLTAYFILNNTPLLYIGISITLSIVSFLLSRKRKTDFIMGDVGIELSESVYNYKIKEKFNL